MSRAYGDTFRKHRKLAAPVLRRGTELEQTAPTVIGCVQNKQARRPEKMNVKWTTVIAGLGAAWLGTATTAGAADAKVALDIAGAYVFRGVTLNDGVVAQPGMTVSGKSCSLFAWGNLDLDDYDGRLVKNQFSEIDLGASYSLPVDMLDLSIGYLEYAYPNGGAADREVNLTLSAKCPLVPSLSINYGLDGALEKALYLELGLAHTFALCPKGAFLLRTTLGYLDPDNGARGFSHFTATADIAYAMVHAGVTYIGQIDDKVLADVADGGGYDVDVVAVVGLAFDF
jgi:hypothetical protein